MHPTWCRISSINSMWCVVPLRFMLTSPSTEYPTGSKDFRNIQDHLPVGVGTIGNRKKARFMGEKTPTQSRRFVCLFVCCCFAAGKLSWLRWRKQSLAPSSNGQVKISHEFLGVSIHVFSLTKRVCLDGLPSVKKRGIPSFGGHVFGGS